MPESKMDEIGRNIFRYQAALIQAGYNLEEFVKKHYISKWLGDTLFAACAIRTTFVTTLQNFLAEQGLFNMEKISISPITDPLAHDVEHIPTINYKGQLYVTTHSMIYNKFLACFNPKTKGIFVDSPNIRLEIEDVFRQQRGKYLIDFSQMDIEVRRNRNIDFERYLDEPEKVKEILEQDMQIAFDLFEKMIIAALQAILKRNAAELNYLGVTLEIPEQPFPVFRSDELKKRFGLRDYEAKIGEEIKEQIFWVRGIARENYDLIYPYILKNGKTDLATVTSDMVYNYDIYAKSIITKTNQQTPAKEIFSGAIREWIYEAILERLIDNKIIKTRPVFRNGNIENIDELGSYGPFLTAANARDENGVRLFPETFGGGIGIERTLYALCRGEILEKIDDVTFFGKNPDSFPLYLF